MPGLIDTHMHTAQQFLRGKLFAISQHRKLKVPPWKNYYVPFESTLTEDDVYLSGLSTYIDMISVGTTFFLEAGGPHPDAMGQAAEEVGIRGRIALSTIDSDPTLPPNMRMTTEEAVRANEALVKRWRDRGRVQAWLSIRQIIVATEGLQREIAALATELDTKVHTHLAEGAYEIDFSLARWGVRPAEHLAELGVFNDRLHTGHAVLLSHEEMNLYQQCGVSASHCAFVNYAQGQPRMLEMWRRGIPIGLGTDGAAVWGPLDIFQVAHIARVGQQAIAGTPNHFRNVTSCDEMLEVAIKGGARAAGMAEELGALAVGKRADIILVAAQDPDQIPPTHPLFTVANTSVGRDVRTVIIDGKVVMKNREILTVDVAEIAAKLRPRHAALMERFDEAVK